MKNIIGVCVCTASLLLVLATFPGTIRHLQYNENDNDANKAIIMPSNKNLHNINFKNERQ